MSTKADATKETTKDAAKEAAKAAESVIGAATKIIEDAAAKGREQYDSAVEAIGPKVKELREIEIKVPASAATVVDGYFDFASKMLATQREFFTNLVAAPDAKVEKATTSVKRAAKSTAQTAKKTSKAASKTATKTAKKTASKTASKTGSKASSTSDA